MYSVVLMAALASGTTAPDCHYKSYSCCGGYYGHSCCGGYSYGCCGGGYYSGCCGGYSYGCCGGGYYYGGCYGSYSYGSCWGCCGGSPYSMMPYPYATPAPAPAEKVPAPKTDEPKKDDKKEGALAPNVGRVVVEVPADAKLYIDGQLMKTTAERRTFRTPELVPGQQYFYDLRAEVTVDGKTETESLRVIVKGGVTADASFPKLVAAVEASKALVKK